jgi:hypothetical protein
MESDEKTPIQIELCPEKGRREIEDIPNSLVYWSIAIIVIVFIALVAVVCLVPYPYADGESIGVHIIEWLPNSW